MTNILGTTEKCYHTKTVKTAVLSTIPFIVVVVVNILLCVFFRAENRIAFTVINIITDIAVCWILIFNFINIISVRAKILSLYKKKSFGQRISGTITVSGTVHSLGFECKEYTITENDVMRKVLFAVEGAINPVENAKVTLTTVNNIVVEMSNE